MLKHRNSDPEFREILSEASRGSELRERLPTDEGVLEILDVSIQDRVRCCSRKTKVAYERWTYKHKCLPHFAFLLFKVDVVLDFWNLRIPLVVRIHLNLSQELPLYSSFLFFF